MKRRVLLSVYEAPGFGGSSTACYALHSKLLRDGVDSHLVLCIGRWEVPYYRWAFGEAFANPRSLDNVYLSLLEEGRDRYEEDLDRSFRAIAPDVVLCQGHVAARSMVVVAGDVPVVFYLGGIPQTTALGTYRPGEVVEAIRRHRASARKPDLIVDGEAQALVLSRLTVPCSDLVAEACRALLPDWLSRHLFSRSLTSAEWIVEEARYWAVEPLSFADRDIDLLLVASSWLRWEKNLPLVRRLVARVPDLDVHIIGHCPTPVAGATHHDLVTDRRQVLGLMARSRALVCPSLVDAAPGVLYEAAAMGCNLVASKNCGNWELCDDDLLVDPLGDEGLVAAARRATRRPYENHLDRFLHSGSFDRLKEVLAHL